MSWCLLAPILLLQTLGLPSQTLANSASTASSTDSDSTTVPAPLVVPPSQGWDGNDGPWSSFFLRVGTPAQTVSVQISTAGNQPLVVLPEGCSSSDPSDCASSRGTLFQTNQSSTWVQNNVTANGIFSLAIETNLGYNVNALYGYDTVVLSYPGSGTPTLTNQVVGGIAAEDIYMGLFGLNPASTNFTDYNDPVPSYMSNLKNQSKIPSLSYGYTAGAPYRFNKVLGSLTIGGYDASLFEPNDLTFGFDSQSNTDLTVNVNLITFSAGNTNQTLSSTSFPAFIDSTLPYLWLPGDVCEKFEHAFGIGYDNATGLYLVNDTLHMQLLSQNANVTFTLTNATAQAMVDIVLPYEAFDLTADYPLVQNATRYFPLKRANNNSQTTLGRAFLQEAYLIADYERYNFSVSQRLWNADAKEDIRTILPPSNISQNSSSRSIPIGAIVGAAVGGVVLIALVIGLAFFFRRKRRLQTSRVSAQAPLKPPDNNFTSPAISVFKPELDASGTSRMAPELDAGQLSKRPQPPVKTPLEPEQIHEMPAREAVGSELFGSSIGEGPVAKMTTSRGKEDSRQKQLVNHSERG